MHAASIAACVHVVCDVCVYECCSWYGACAREGEERRARQAYTRGWAERRARTWTCTLCNARVHTRDRHACMHAPAQNARQRRFSHKRDRNARAADAELLVGPGRARARADGGRLGRRRTLAKREVNASDMSSRCSVHRPEHPSTAPGRIASSAHNRSAAALACASREITQTGIKAPPRGVPGACVRPRAPLIVAPW